MPPTDQDTPDTPDLTEWHRQLGILLGDVALSFDDPHAVLAHVKKTCVGPDVKDFKRARLAMGVARQLAPNDVKLAQQHALFTYKDLEYSPAQRFAEALEILESIGLRE
ncbi:MAG: hypothetical protein O7B29_03480, partial [Deltaproteobacteria bacterium]|nr:hypothetical protein [Deltaproteobacteria bacterium]